ncbi:NAD-binding protein [Allorhizocola rhizosphaerae]|uniref:NAD-binding protein n=1 Tax=Allorhizocola rhizosphaerae TaxID=1872709 RepID=UPI000E3C86FF|nr:NAD-binding protein [Allorhizocola rhizosphaerae]
MTSPRSDHFVINGADGLTYRLAEQLSVRYGASVVVLMTAQQRMAAKDFSELAGVRVVVRQRIDEQALREVGLATAAGLALTAQDDVGNIHVALLARELAPALRVVVRMYNTDLGHSIEALLGNCKVLSDSEIAAPVLVATALGEIAATPVQVGRRTLVVARRDAVAAHEIVCELAFTAGTGGEPHMLPAEDEPADLVLAEARRSALESTHRVAPSRAERASRIGLLVTFLRTLVTRKSRIAVSVVLGVMVVAGAILGASRGLSIWDGFYLAVVTALGGLQTTPEFSRGQQVWQLVLGVAGLAFIPLVTALVVEGMVRARLAVAQVRLRLPQSDHVVVVGLGGVGTRVLRLLHHRGVKTVAIAPDEQARGVPVARELQIPLIIGDPSRVTTLRTAGVDRCRALMAVSNNDVSNLEVALHGRNLQEHLHVVLRVFDGDLAARARRILNLPLSRSVSYLAAPAFAEALMEREVIGTIAVERRVLLLAEVFVPPGSPLEGTTVAAVDEPGSVRVIAVTEFGEPRPLWKPPLTRRVRTRDKLTVVATRDGLSRLIAQQGPG